MLSELSPHIRIFSPITDKHLVALLVHLPGVYVTPLPRLHAYTGSHTNRISARCGYRLQPVLARHWYVLSRSFLDDKVPDIILLGQVGGVGLSSAIFQSSLNTELHKRITGPGSEEVSRPEYSMG